MRPLLVLAFTLTITLAAGPKTTAFNETPYLHPQRLITVGHDQRINLYCTGDKGPSVILVGGFAEPAYTWRYVQPRLARFAHVCSYDEPATGFSSAAPLPLTSEAAANTLYVLLQRAAVRPPYVIVAHSLGGFTARLIADKHPADIAAMVLLDPTPEGFAESLYSIVPKLRAMDAEALASETKCISDPKPCVPPRDPHLSRALNDVLRKPLFSPATWRDRISGQQHVQQDEHEIRTAQRFYGNMPLIVLSRGASTSNDSSAPFSARQGREIDEARQKLQHAIITESTRGEFLIVQKTGHFIMEDRPDVVIQAIKRAINEASLQR